MHILIPHEYVCEGINILIHVCMHIFVHDPPQHVVNLREGSGAHTHTHTISTPPYGRWYTPALKRTQMVHDPPPQVVNTL